MMLTMVLLFVAPQGGPQGIMMTIGGKPVDITKWRCQTVSNLGDANKRYKGWYGATYYGNWGVAKVCILYDCSKSNCGGRSVSILYQGCLECTIWE